MRVCVYVAHCCMYRACADFSPPLVAPLHVSYCFHPLGPLLAPSSPEPKCSHRSAIFP